MNFLKILLYIVHVLMILVPIIGIISAIVNRNKKEYKEVDYFISSNKNDEWYG